MHPTFHVSIRLIATRPTLLQFEEGLRNAADPNGLHQRAKIQATLLYYSSRMEAVSFFHNRIQTLVLLANGPRGLTMVRSRRGEKAMTHGKSVV